MMGTDDKPWLTVVGVVGPGAPQRHRRGAAGRDVHRARPAARRTSDRRRAGWRWSSRRAATRPRCVPALRQPSAASTRSWRSATSGRWTIWPRTHLANARFTALMLGAFAVLALVLALVGLYGAVSLVTDERAPEIGVRMALGAERGSILRLVLGEGVVLTAVGAGLGVRPPSALLARAIAGQLYGVSAARPATFVAVPLLFSAVARWPA